jgi:hypothetical protein
MKDAANGRNPFRETMQKAMDQLAMDRRKPQNPSI